VFAAVVQHVYRREVGGLPSDTVLNDGVSTSHSMRDEPPSRDSANEDSKPPGLLSEQHALSAAVARGACGGSPNARQRKMPPPKRDLKKSRLLLRQAAG
jgi:hypothetical protein